MIFLQPTRLVSILSLKIPFTIIFSTFILIASLDHLLRYATSVIDRPCRSLRLEDTSLCKLFSDSGHRHRDLREASSPLDLAAVSLLMDDAVGLAKSSSSDTSSLVVQLAHAVQEYQVLSREHQDLRAHANRIFNQVYATHAYLQSSVKHCWISHTTIEAICPQWVSELCARCSTRAVEAHGFFLTSVKIATTELVPVINQVHRAHVRLLRTLRGVQDILSEEAGGVGAEVSAQGVIFHLWGALIANRDEIAHGRAIAGVHRRRKDAVTYLLLVEQILQLAASELKQLQELIAFLERSPIAGDYGTFPVLLQTIMQIQDHLLSFNTPTMHATRL